MVKCRCNWFPFYEALGEDVPPPTKLHPPPPSSGCSLSCVRASSFFSFSLFLYLYRSISLTFPLYPPLFLHMYSSLLFRTSRTTRVRRIERINTHYNVSAGALDERAALPGLIVFSRLVPRWFRRERWWWGINPCPPRCLGCILRGRKRERDAFSSFRAMQVRKG